MFNTALPRPRSTPSVESSEAEVLVDSLRRKSAFVYVVGFVLMNKTIAVLVLPND